MSIRDRCQNLISNIPTDVRIIAASKTKRLEDVREAYEAGISNFGENYVQEGLEKALALPQATWHFIGKLQRNKVNMALKGFTVFHTIDSAKLMNKLGSSASRENITVEVYIQVNIANEPQKAGCSINDLPLLLEEAQAHTSINVVGLMAIPPANEDPVPHFRKLSDLAKSYKLGRLSMGMSGDWEEAIKHGSTDIRLGTSIFGPRR